MAEFRRAEFMINALSKHVGIMHLAQKLLQLLQRLHCISRRLCLMGERFDQIAKSLARNARLMSLVPIRAAAQGFEEGGKRVAMLRHELPDQRCGGWR